jgi:ribokinase
MPNVCVVGSSNVDLTFRTPRLPRPGETVAGTLFHFGCGGKGGNQAVMAARLGARVSFVTRVGRDPFGQHLVDHYRQEGIELPGVLHDSSRNTGSAAIIVDDHARNCIIVVPGANEMLSPDDVRAAADAVRRADIVVCQLEVPLAAVVEAFEIGKAQGVRTILNPAPAAQLPPSLLRLTDVCVPNESELENLTARPVRKIAEAKEAARVLRDQGAETVIVTLGKQGALLVTDDRAEQFPAFAVNAIDPTGAGDAFVAGLAVLLAEGRGVDDAIRKANRLAAFTVTRHGTQSAFPSQVEARALIESAPELG